MIKVRKRKILLLPGDGIGPEVIGEVKKIIQWFNDKKSLDFEIDEDLAGGCSYDKHGTPITDEVFYKALESAVVMLGAVGGPKWDDVEFSKKPERALLKLRKELKGRYLEVKYEDIVESPEENIKQMLEYASVDYSEEELQNAINAKVVESSYYGSKKNTQNWGKLDKTKDFKSIGRYESWNFFNRFIFNQIVKESNSKVGYNHSL